MNLMNNIKQKLKTSSLSIHLSSHLSIFLNSKRTKEICSDQYKKFIEDLMKNDDVEEEVKRMIVNSRSDLWNALEDPSLILFLILISFFLN